MRDTSPAKTGNSKKNPETTKEKDKHVALGGRHEGNPRLIQ